MIVRQRVSTMFLALTALVSVVWISTPGAAVAAPLVSEAATVDRDFTLKVRWEGLNNEDCPPWPDTSLYARCEVRYKTGNSAGFTNADGLVQWSPGASTGLLFQGSERNYIAGTVSSRNDSVFTVRGFNSPQYGRVADGQKLRLTVVSKDVFPGGYVQSNEFTLTGRLQVTPPTVTGTPGRVRPPLFGSS